MRPIKKLPLMSISQDATKVPNLKKKKKIKKDNDIGYTIQDVTR